jgi:uncharacterized membrane protein YdbT with pleckstrin-like domain
MSYIEHTMMRGEKVVHRTRPHEVVYLRAALWAVCGACLGLILGRILPCWIGVLVAGAAFAVSLPKVLDQFSLEYGVTNRRMFIKGGWISRRTLETALNKVGAIAVDQGPLGRLLGYGDVVVMTAGGGREVLPRIRAPLEFRKNVFEQILAAR